MKARRAYVILALISLALSGTSAAISQRAISSSDHKFCDVVSSFIAKPVLKPSNPSADPSREQSYEWYIRFAKLDKSLGC